MRPAICTGRGDLPASGCECLHIDRRYHLGELLPWAWLASSMLSPPWRTTMLPLLILPPYVNMSGTIYLSILKTECKHKALKTPDEKPNASGSRTPGYRHSLGLRPRGSLSAVRRSRCPRPVGRSHRGANREVSRHAPAHAYWITSSAWKRSIGAMVRPSARAALRLTTMTSRVGNSTGKSPGALPFKILCTNVAAWRKHQPKSTP